MAVGEWPFYVRDDHVRQLGLIKNEHGAGSTERGARSGEQRAKSEAQSAKGEAQKRLALSAWPESMRAHFRFEDLEIWKLACQIAVTFHRIADRLDNRRLYRYAEQLRAAGLSLPNNIAEGSGSIHKQEFIQFLNIARRSVFEDAYMLLVFPTLGLVT